jgi:hypothetical protein
VRRCSPDGAEERSWGSLGKNPGQFTEPVGITVDAQGKVYVVDNGNARLQIFDRDGALIGAFPVEGWDFNDPLTTGPQPFLKDAYAPANFGTEAQANRRILRLLIPRVPRLAFIPDQLIRPTFQLVTVPTGRGTATRAEPGDIQLFDLSVLPWSSRKRGVHMGAGPVFVFPTATETAPRARAPGRSDRRRARRPTGRR